MLNDDYTPMEFVVHILERFFNKNLQEATRIMLHVHRRGVGICGVYTYEVAETKVTQVMDFAGSTSTRCSVRWKRTRPRKDRRACCHAISKSRSSGSAHANNDAPARVRDAEASAAALTEEDAPAVRACSVDLVVRAARCWTEPSHKRTGQPCRCA